MILPNSLQSTPGLPHFVEDAPAWVWIARQLSRHPRLCVVPLFSCKGLCIMLAWMRDSDMISSSRKVTMCRRLYTRFQPRNSLGERGDGPFFWKQGVRAPRVVAAQLMAILPVPRQGGREG